MRDMNCSDAHRNNHLYLPEHVIHGMLGSFDCMHIGWYNCLVAWQFEFQGDKKEPTIVLEAISNYTPWI
jgi:hypothetical protein